MIIGIKSAVRLIGISIISCCAVLVCAMFVNYYIDIQLIRDDIASENAMILYTAQLSTAKVVSLVSGGCLLATSVIMLLFYIKHYIDTHKRELGILKAMGYSDICIAKSFWVFGLSVFTGALVGSIGAYTIMPRFYLLQNKDKILPNIALHFHPSVIVYFVLLPTLFFSLLAICYSLLQLKMPVMLLLRDSSIYKKRKKNKKQTEYKHDSCSFVEDLKRSTLRNNKVLVFFISFASFCYSAMTQMSFSMKDLSSRMMGIMILVIGLVLAFTTLYISVTTVMRGNIKTIAMMRVFGYSQKECCSSLLGPYRIASYIGFAIGTVYQYILLRITVDVVFKDMEGMPAYSFDHIAMLISLASFILLYELLMYTCSERIKKISVKEIMTE